MKDFSEADEIHLQEKMNELPISLLYTALKENGRNY